MRSHKDRRKANDATLSPCEDNGRPALVRDRRRHQERRLENLDIEERQLMLSEMPSPTIKKPS